MSRRLAVSLLLVVFMTICAPLAWAQEATANLNISGMT
jgi:hypothetical protein